jgi:hypothetical protein
MRAKIEGNCEDTMNKKIISLSVLIVVILFVGAIFYYNGVVNDKNSQIILLNQIIAEENSQISNLTAQVSNLLNMTRTNENITFTNFNSYSLGIGNSYNWTLTLDLKNIGNVTAIINNIIINGKSYSSFNPVPIVTPSIQNGFELSPNQSVEITLKNTNSTSAPHYGTYVYVLTARGNSYRSPFIGS